MVDEKIFINEALQFYKKTDKISFSDNNYILEQEDRADIIIIQSFHHDQITKIIQSLPVKMRMVFNLYVIDGFSHKEIAQKMNISEGTSKSNLHDARKILKQKITSLDLEINLKSNVI